MSTEPDEWDEPAEPSKPSEPTGPPQPGIIRAAGIVWIAMGIVFVLFGFANMFMSALLAAKQPNRVNNGTESCSVWLSFAIGAALLVAGKNVRSGKAKDVVVSSILLGLFYAAAGIGAFFFLAWNEVLAVVVGAISIFIAIGSIFPAVLALAGRSQYLEWRLSRREYRRRRREAEDSEAEDSDRGPESRPWERGRGDPT